MTALADIEHVRQDGSVSAPILRVAGVSKRFRGDVALRGVDLDVTDGEFLTLLGPSGCGKTTLLRVIGGFEVADEGTVQHRAQDISSLPPERRPFTMVFQSYALFPHMSVRQNVAYGLQAAATPPADVARRVEQTLTLAHLEKFADRPVTVLSGGQQQRVALARALVKEPEVLLLDEPLAALDLKLRQRLQEELRAIQRRLATTFIYVTHDQEEALTLSDRICVMNEGELVQTGSPREVYEQPRTRFVADFIGDANMVPATVITARRDTATVRFETGEVGEFHHHGADSPPTGADVLVVLRPEELRTDVENGPRFTGEVTDSIFLGTHVRQEITCNGGMTLRLRSPASTAPIPGSVTVGPAPGAGVVVLQESRP